MGLNKKQKKQLDVARDKLGRLQQLLQNERKQPDDPAEIKRLETEIAAIEADIEKIKAQQ